MNSSILDEIHKEQKIPEAISFLGGNYQTILINKTKCTKAYPDDESVILKAFHCTFYF
jgi:hypothetical protein